MANLNLKTLASKTVQELSTSSNIYIYTQDTTTNVANRVLLSDITKELPAVVTGTGASIYKSMGTTGKQIHLRSIASTSPFISVSQLSDSVSFSIRESVLDLSFCNNSESAFLSTVDLTKNIGTTILPVANGGTGVATLTDGGLLLGSGTGAITAMSVLDAGEIIYGDGTTDPATVKIGTANQVLTVNAEATAPTWAAAVNTWVGTATGDLDMANNDIDLGTGYLSADGTTAGVRVTGNNIYVGASANYVNTEALNLDGNILITGRANRTIKVAAPASGAGYGLGIYGGNATTSGQAGGNTTIYAGNGIGGGAGGNVVVSCGTSPSGTSGNLIVQTWDGADVYNTLNIKNNSRSSFQSGNSSAITPDATLEINQQSVTGAIPCLTLDQDDVDYAFMKLDGSAGSGTGYNLDTEPAGDTSGSTVAAPHSAAWTMVGMVKILVGADVRYLPYYSRV
tara:strand:+ start:897 stop:2258 length:1362 start_codon:yes stop_codon:yes gene_type:complete